jgi:CubicO group peptidase (beta-lactamase class C family)
MKIVLYIIFALLILLIGFFTWFFKFYHSIPGLKIDEEMSESERIETIDSWFQKLQEDDKFNGVVFFSRNGEILLSKGYGYTDYRKNKMLTNESSLRLASVSKQFTAAGILRLTEKGMLNLDDYITVYIPDLPYKKVMVRNLLNQTSGIPDIYLELAENEKENIDLLTNQLAVELIINERRKAAFKPNEKFQYSNTNYVILARIIEVVSELSFETFMKTEIFTPLGMKNTRVWNLLSEDSTFSNKANDFDNQKANAKDIKPTFIDGVAGDGAVFSSANDMLIWDGFWYGNELISEPILKEAFKKPELLDGKQSGYGFGWVITENGMWHNGAWLGSNTIIIRNIKKKTCTAIFDNSSNLFFDKILKELMKKSKPG